MCALQIVGMYSLKVGGICMTAARGGLKKELVGEGNVRVDLREHSCVWSRESMLRLQMRQGCGSEC